VTLRFFATAAKGTEPALRDELRELRFRRVRADRGGVHFEGEIVDAARACLWSRVALRILLEIGVFEAASEAALYDGARGVDWPRWMTPETSLAVRATCRSSHLTHSQFVAQKTKDAIVDALRDKFGRRPSVDREHPDVGVAVHLLRDRATLYLDVGGSSLHERGWRLRPGPAPLRETLAAAILRLSGWDRTTPLVDPMCGAGTLAIEAAMWSRNRAPGLSRPRFGLERWANCDAEVRAQVDALRTQAQLAARRGGAPIFASDWEAQAVEWASVNAQAAGVDITIERRDVADLQPLFPAGFVVTNPPYGERVEVDAGLYEKLARAVTRLRGHTVALLASSPAIERAMRRPPDRWWILYNGPIECRLLVYGF
jgi:23S rRNA (guanine2445-N2)-methyltransferase